jgi:cytochrome c oxidase cbb3-type subunit IV
MEIEHETLVYFSKFYGLIYLILLSALVLIYTFWPKNKKRFDYAAKSILDEEDKPHA